MDFSVNVLKNNLTNPQRIYMWEVLIPTPVGGGQSETFSVRARSAEIPGSSFGTINIPYKQTAGIVVAGKLQYDHKWECVLIEGEDHAVYDALYEWQQQIVNNLTGIGVGDPLYKTDMYIILQDTTGETGMKIKLKGAYIEAIGKVGLDYENEGIVKYPVTFAFDSFEKV